MSSGILARWREFIDTHLEIVAERLDLLDRVESSGWATSYLELLNASRLLLETTGTPNEARWAEEVVTWARNAAELERTRDDMIECRIREELSRRREGGVAPGVYANRGGPSNDCDPNRVRLAVFSLNDHAQTGIRLGCRDLTPPEARALAAKLLEEAAAVEGAS